MCVCSVSAIANNFNSRSGKSAISTIPHLMFAVLHLLFPTFSDLSIWTGICCLTDAPHRSPVPKSNTTKAKEAAHFVHANANLRTRETLSQAKVPGLGRTGHPGKNSEDDRRPSENMVSIGWARTHSLWNHRPHWLTAFTLSELCFNVYKLSFISLQVSKSSN